MKTRNRFKISKLSKTILKKYFANDFWWYFHEKHDNFQYISKILENIGDLYWIPNGKNLCSGKFSKFFVADFFRQLQIFKSISGLHCDFKCEKLSLESPARGSHTWYKYANTEIDCRVKSLSRCFPTFWDNLTFKIYENRWKL